jgi:hypothetical protein
VIFLTELEKLQKAAELIEAMTDGKQLFGTINGTPQIFMDQGVEWHAEYPSIAIRMKRASTDNKQFTVSFHAHLDMIGPGMDAAAMRGLEKTVRKFRTLLDALEAQTFTPTRSELKLTSIKIFHKRESVILVSSVRPQMRSELSNEHEYKQFAEWIERREEQTLEQQKDIGPTMGR